MGAQILFKKKHRHMKNTLKKIETKDLDYPEPLLFYLIVSLQRNSFVCNVSVNYNLLLTR